MQNTSIKQKIGLTLFGIFLCIAFLEIGLRVGGFIILSMREHRNRASFRKINAYSIVCIGESTTALGGENSWPAQLEKVLNARKVETSFKVINEGREDTNTVVIVSRLEKILDKYNPNMVIVMTGINDTASTMPYENSWVVNTKLFFSGFRVNKLRRILWMHIINKTRELGFYRFKESAIKEEANLSYISPRDNYVEKEIDKEPKGIPQETAPPKEKEDRKFVNSGKEGQLDYQESEAMYKKLLEINPENDIAIAGLGHLYNTQKKYQEAEEMFKKAIALNPGNASAYEGLIICYSEQGKYGSLEDVLKNKIMSDEENIETKKEAERESLENYVNVDYTDYAESEVMLKKTLGSDPHNDVAYTALGRIYNIQTRYAEAEAMFKEDVGLNPRNDEAYVGLGRCYREQSIYARAEEVIQIAIQLNPQNVNAYVMLGECYSEQGEYEKAETMLKKALKLDPNNSYTYIALESCYRDQKKYQENEEILKKAIEMIPANSRAYIELGHLYTGQERYQEAEAMFKKAIEIIPWDFTAYLGLGVCYRTQGKFQEIEELSKKIIKDGINNDRLYGLIAISYLDQGEYREAKKYYKKADELRLRRYSPATRYNYRKLKEIVTQRGIKLVCMQYPLRSIEPLKKLFDSTEGIIFVENKKIFEDALRHGRYEDYFADNFGGEFGHGTPLGNRLIAENVANVILKEVFNKQ